MKTTMRRILLLAIIVGLSALLACFLPLLAQEKDTAYTTSGYISIPRDSLLITGYKFYDKWDWKTISFPKSSDTMRIIIDKDTIFTNENYFRVLVRYEIGKMRGKKSR